MCLVFFNIYRYIQYIIIPSFGIKLTICWLTTFVTFWDYLGSFPGILRYLLSLLLCHRMVWTFHAWNLIYLLLYHFLGSNRLLLSILHLAEFNVICNCRALTEMMSALFVTLMYQSQWKHSIKSLEELVVISYLQGVFYFMAWMIVEEW